MIARGMVAPALGGLRGYRTIGYTPRRFARRESRTGSRSPGRPGPSAGPFHVTYGRLHGARAFGQPGSVYRKPPTLVTVVRPSVTHRSFFALLLRSFGAFAVHLRALCSNPLDILAARAVTDANRNWVWRRQRA